MRAPRPPRGTLRGRGPRGRVPRGRVPCRSSEPAPAVASLLPGPAIVCKLLALLVVLADPAGAIVISGHLNTSAPVAVLGKFVFRATKQLGSAAAGDVFYDLQYPEYMDDLTLLFFFENLDNWNKDVDAHTTCAEYLALASSRGNVFPVRPFSSTDGAQPGFRHSSLNIPFQTSYDRYFFFVLVNCQECGNPLGDVCMNNGPLMDISYTIAASNPTLEPFDQVSFDEYIAPGFTFAAVVIVGAYTILQTVSSIKLFQAHMFHHTVTLLQVACLLQLLAMMCMTILYAQMERPCEQGQGCEVPVSRMQVVNLALVFPAVVLGLPAGLLLALIVGFAAKRHLFTIFNIGLLLWPLSTIAFCFYPMTDAQSGVAGYEDYAETFRLAGTLCFRLSDWVFLLLLILLAKGWTIVRRTIKPQTQLRIALFMCTNLVAIVFSVITDAYAQRTLRLEHYWETPAGVLVLVLQLLFYFWFVQSTLHTVQRFKKQKAKFYVKFFLFYSGWTLVLPALMLILSRLLDANSVRGVLYYIEHGITVAAQFGLVTMYYPDAKCNKGFPFHAMIHHMKAEKRLTAADLHRPPGSLPSVPPNSAAAATAAAAAAAGQGREVVVLGGDAPDSATGTTAAPVSQEEAERRAREVAERRALQRAKRVREGGGTITKFLVQSNVLVANPLTRCRVKLDAVQFRIHRLKMSVDSALASLRTLESHAEVAGNNNSKAGDDDGDEASDAGGDASPAEAKLDGQGPVVSSASRAAQRFKVHHQQQQHQQRGGGGGGGGGGGAARTNEAEENRGGGGGGGGHSDNEEEGVVLNRHGGATGAGGGEDAFRTVELRT